MMTDPVDLTAALVRCPSVTPEEGGAIRLLERLLAAGGFVTHRADRNGIANLYARWGAGGPVFGFNGHTDVVPPGDAAAWRHPPFAAAIDQGRLYGRGAADMKSGVAAFAAAALDFVSATPPSGSIVLAITGDEEGDSVDGTPAILDWMAANGERLDHCLVGEPTCPERLGDTMKIGRRG
ncbi:MAG TPA: M20/M25/M40 family metallo-hydrolase, partial [Amaricoccus sp.]|nr:M20/M25/M40 family metallo-hydrolase [Amaricoccus sp.]